eukprot:scaffold24106_cov146-Isochrysis_galbana.AAC.1
MVWRRWVHRTGLGVRVRRRAQAGVDEYIAARHSGGGEGWALERKRLGARQPVDSAWSLRRLRRPGERGAEGACGSMIVPWGAVGPTTAVCRSLQATSCPVGECLVGRHASGRAVKRCACVGVRHVGSVGLSVFRHHRPGAQKQAHFPSTWRRGKEGTRGREKEPTPRVSREVDHCAGALSHPFRGREESCDHIQAMWGQQGPTRQLILPHAPERPREGCACMPWGSTPGINNT